MIKNIVAGKFKRDFLESCKKVHKAQVEKGHYKEFRDDTTLLLLIKSELFEAFEAYKSNKPLVSSITREALDNFYNKDADAAFINLYDSYVKGTIEGELVDVQIRLKDFIGFKEYDLNHHIVDIPAVGVEELTDFISFCAFIDYQLSRMLYGIIDPNNCLTAIITVLVQYSAALLQLDVMEKYKLYYNKITEKSKTKII